MSKLWKFVLPALFLVLSQFAVAAMPNAEQAGTSLAQAVYDRPHGRNISSRGSMILIDPGHSPRIRQMYVYSRDQGGGETASLIRFVTPTDIAGTGMLTIDHAGDRTDQWIYLPALDRTRRIASSRKGGRFVGSDIYYEDLRDREVAMDRHRLLGKEKFQGVTCDVLESVPSDPGNSVYSKRISWIHPSTLIALRVDFYERGKSSPIKRLVVHRIEKIQGYWTVMDSTMTDLSTGHETRLTVQNVIYDRALPDTLFSREMLSDPAREAAFRPGAK